MRFFRRKRSVPVIEFGETFILRVNGTHLHMRVNSVQSNYGHPTYGTIATLDHFMGVDRG